MNSKTKVALDQSTIEKIIKKAFGDAVEIKDYRALSGGVYNSIYAIELEDKEVVLKVAPPNDLPVLSYENDVIRTEVDMLKLMTSVEFPVPEVLYFDDSLSILNHKYFIMSMEEGMPLSTGKNKLGGDEEDALRKTLGSYMAQLHEVKNDYFGYPQVKASQSNHWFTTFKTMMQMIIDDGKKANVKVPGGYEAILALVDKHKHVFEAVKEPRLVYFDMWDGNVMIDVPEKKISCFVDAERALWADPHFDFVSVALFKNIEDQKMILEGYNEASETAVVIDDDFRVKVGLYRMYLYLIMAIEPSYRFGGFAAWAQRRFIFKSIKKEMLFLNLF